MTPPRPGSGDPRTSFDVRIWGIRKYTGKSGTTYNIRWVAARRQRSKSFATRALADSFRGELRAALTRGEPFDVETGLPVAMVPSDSGRGIGWWDWALEYVDLKWPTLAPTSRRSLAEAMVTITMALLTAEPTKPSAKQLRSAMSRWAFVTPRRKKGPPPAELAAAVEWLAKNTRPLSDLDRAVVARDVLTALSQKLDGAPAGATTAARKRMVFHNCLALAVERELLPANPLDRVRWRTAKNTEAVDPSTVVNPAQARDLIEAVRQVPGGERYVAFFAVLYYAGARPSEALALHWTDIEWPEQDGDWGWLRIRRSNAHVTSTWTDTGRRSTRQLKHRPTGTIRPVPCAPALVDLLRAHRELMPGVDPRVFRGMFGTDLQDKDYLRVWRAARTLALTPEQAEGSLAKTPYSLRHACVSTWLAAGVAPTQVAAWAGHSVAVLLRVYAHVIDHGATDALTRVSRAISPEMDTPQPP